MAYTTDREEDAMRDCSLSRGPLAVSIVLLAAIFCAGSAAAQSQPPSPRPKRIPVGGSVAMANLIFRVDPVYPPLAMQAHIQGTVVLHAIIAVDGSMKELKVISGPALLIQSALDAVGQWRYRPTLLNGEPVEVDTTISVVFTLDGASPSQALSSSPLFTTLTTVDEDWLKARHAEFAAVDPAMVTEIRRLFRVMFTEEALHQVVASSFEQMRPQLLHMLPEGANRDRVLDSFMKTMEAGIEDAAFLDLFIPIYAKHFSREQIKAIADFYESDAGRAFVENQKAMVTAGTTIGDQFSKKVLIPRAIKQVVAQYPEYFKQSQ